MSATTARVTYSRLTHAARDEISWSNLTIAAYVRYHFPDGQWGGDRCGCTDDRCIGYHHDVDEDCECLPVLIGEAVEAARRA